MGISSIDRRALSIGVFAALLAGCGGAQSPIVAPIGASPAQRTNSTGAYTVLYSFARAEPTVEPPPPASSPLMERSTAPPTWAAESDATCILVAARSFR